jgi:ribosome biogenesis ATPase
MMTVIIEAKHRDSEPPVKMRRVNESDSEDIDDAIDDIEDRQTNNSMNGKLLNLYKKSAPTDAATPGFSFAAYASSLQSDSTQAETDQPVDDDNEPNIDSKSESKSKKPETGSQRRAAKRAASSAAPGGLAAKTIASMICERPSVTYADVGGVDTIIQDLRELIEWPMTHPEIYAHLGMEPPRGILLHGPPGCGKV